MNIYGNRRIDVLLDDILKWAKENDIKLKANNTNAYEFRIFDEDEDELDEDMPPIDVGLNVHVTGVDAVAFCYKQKQPVNRRATFILDTWNSNNKTNSRSPWQALTTVYDLKNDFFIEQIK
eukprot:UN25090